MNTKSDTDRNAFVGRQLSALLEQYDAPTAFSKLDAASGPEYSGVIENYRRLFDGSAEESGLGAHEFLGRFRDTPGFDRKRFFAAFVRNYDEWSVVLQTFWAGIMGLVSYLVSISVIAVVILTFFAIFVIPAFEDMYESFGAPLPEFTQLIF